MIINHKYKFIFFKSKKVGGTSMEIALSKFTSADDIVTKVYSKEEEALRGNLGLTNKNADGLENHSSAADLLKFLEAPQYKNKDIFDSYFKFTIIREPVDLFISRYFFQKNARNHRPIPDNINDWVKQLKDRRSYGKNNVSEENWRIYSLNNKLITDDYITYSKDSGPESKMYEDCSRISEKLNFPENLADIFYNTRAKTQYREKVKVTLSKESIDFIEEMSKPEREVTGMKIAREEYEDKSIRPVI